MTFGLNGDRCVPKAPSIKENKIDCINRTLVQICANARGKRVAKRDISRRATFVQIFANEKSQTTRFVATFLTLRMNLSPRTSFFRGRSLLPRAYPSVVLLFPRVFSFFRRLPRCLVTTADRVVTRKHTHAKEKTGFLCRTNTR